MVKAMSRDLHILTDESEIGGTLGNHGGLSVRLRGTQMLFT